MTIDDTKSLKSGDHIRLTGKIGGNAVYEILKVHKQYFKVKVVEYNKDYVIYDKLYKVDIVNNDVYSKDTSYKVKNDIKDWLKE